MRLSKLLQGIPDGRMIFDGEWEREIGDISADSRQVKEGGLFVCLSGGREDGHDYAQAAVKKGAVALVTERVLPLKIPQIIVRDSRSALCYLAATFYKNPAEHLKIIGITGTNGKTTASYMLSSILRRAGKSVGTIGTLGIMYGKKVLPSPLTTPDPIFLHKTYADMLACGVEYVVQEVSAHALYYKKDAGISYEACIFTNLTQDHLDFFGDMQAYKRAKLSLFSRAKCRLAIVNADDDCALDIEKIYGKEGLCTYGLEMPADCFAVATGESLSSQQFMLNLYDSLCRVSLKMIGRHNIYNSLGAATCAYKLGVNVATVAAGLNGLERVEGRLQYVDSYRGGKIFIDFAHTPDGLKNSLAALKEHTEGRLICVFGCGGNRDKDKRPLMGEIAAKGADFCVLTADNPRFEETLDIIGDIERGYKRVSNRYVIVPDRTKAIEYAVDGLRTGDVLLIAGKGGEDTQEFLGIKYPFNDQDVLRKILARKIDLR